MNFTSPLSLASVEDDNAEVVEPVLLEPVASLELPEVLLSPHETAKTIRHRIQKWGTSLRAILFKTLEIRGLLNKNTKKLGSPYLTQLKLNTYRQK